MVLVSVIICCYNSSKTILKTLEFLDNQDADFEWEIIVVNNNSTDRTIDLVQDFKNNSKANVIIANEFHPGKSFAMLKGIEISNGKYIIICDDDNMLQHDYVRRVYSILESNKDIGVLGGRGILYTEENTTVPFWFSSFQSEYAVGVQSIKSGDISHRGFLWGAGSAFNKNVFQMFIQNGISFKLTCRKGNELTSGGDAEYCSWFLLAGYKLWYDEDLIYQHYITNDRLTKDYLIKLIIGTSSTSNEILITYRNLIMDISSKSNKFLKIRRSIKNTLMLMTFTIKWKDYRFNIQRIFPLSKFLVFDKFYYNLHKVFYFIRKSNQTLSS